MLQISTVAPNTLELLKKIQSISELADTRLVGGTALAFHLGHRLSIDLDLFGSFEQEIITKILSTESFNSFIVLSETNAVKHYLINQIKVDIVNYEQYQWLEKPLIEGQIRVAGLKDIAAMKIAAIANRGSKKDFIDLFFLLNIFDIHEIIEFYKTKYSFSEVFFAIRSLSYFDDAEKDEMPKMYIQTKWEDVKKRVSAEVRQL